MISKSFVIGKHIQINLQFRFFFVVVVVVVVAEIQIFFVLTFRFFFFFLGGGGGGDRYTHPPAVGFPERTGVYIRMLSRGVWDLFLFLLGVGGGGGGGSRWEGLVNVYLPAFKILNIYSSLILLMNKITQCLVKFV